MGVLTLLAESISPKKAPEFATAKAWSRIEEHINKTSAKKPVMGISINKNKNRSLGMSVFYAAASVLVILVISISFFICMLMTRLPSRNLPLRYPRIPLRASRIRSCRSLPPMSNRENRLTGLILKGIGGFYYNRDGSLDIDHAPSLQEILDERGREFLDEHWRRNDLIRFGDYERAWGFKYVNPDNADLTKRIFPLALDVLNANTNWNQNEGY